MKAAGRGGDTDIVHVNPKEIGLLKKMGGAGTRNPKTGLLEFTLNDRQDSATRAGGMGGGHGGSGGGGRSGGGGGGGSGGMSGADMDRMILGTGPMAPSAPGGPTISRGNPSRGPRPNTGDRWGTNAPENPMDPDVAKAHQDYNNAADAYSNSGFADWMRRRAVNLIPGFSQAAPNWEIPSTYYGGTYHDTWSPFAAAASIAGGFAVPGGGIPADLAAQGASDLLHGPQYTFGGGGGWGPTTSESTPGVGPDGLTDKERGGPYGGSSNSASSGGGLGGTNGGGNSSGGHLTNLAQVNQPVSGNSSAPVAVGTPTPTTQPNYQQILASLQQITPGYSVNLPGYKYLRKATV